MSSSRRGALACAAVLGTLIDVDCGSRGDGFGPGYGYEDVVDATGDCVNGCLGFADGGPGGPFKDGSIDWPVEAGPSCPPGTFADLAVTCGPDQGCLAPDGGVWCGSLCGAQPVAEVACGKSSDCDSGVCCVDEYAGNSCPLHATLSGSGWATWCAPTCATTVCTGQADCNVGAGANCYDSYFDYGGTHFGTCR